MGDDWEEWRWTPAETWEDNWSPEREAEQEARDEARHAAFTERLYWSMCLAAQSDNMVPWDNQNGIDDLLAAMLDPDTREKFHSAPWLRTERHDAGLAFDIREDAAGAIDRLIEAEKIEFVVRNGWLCIHVPEAVDEIAMHLDRVPAHAQDKWRDRIRRLSRLRTMPYKEYLQTEEWKRRRQLHRDSALNRCQLCNRKSGANLKLHTHHRTYERRGSERFSDLIVLCEKCHRHFHGIVQDV